MGSERPDLLSESPNLGLVWSYSGFRLSDHRPPDGRILASVAAVLLLILNAKCQVFDFALVSLSPLSRIALVDEIDICILQTNVYTY